MATWREISLECLGAAQLLHESGSARSATSRAYFAAYAAVAARLPRSMTFGADRPNPPHSTIHRLVQHNIAQGMGQTKRSEVVRIIRGLRANRLASDYDAGATIDRATSHQCVRDAARFIDLLEVA